jgi:predicted PurR-regulated permease PerM
MPTVQPLPPLARSLAGLGLVGIVLVLLHLAAPVLVPVLFAFFLAALAMPSFQWLQRRGVRRGLALLLLIVVLLGGGIALIALALVSIRSLQAGLELYSGQLAARLAELEAALMQSGIDLAGASGQAAAVATSALRGFLRATANVASNALVSLVVVAFFLLESERFLRILRSDAVQDRPLLNQAPRLARTAVQYFGIRTRLNLLTGAGVSVICFVLGVDYPLLWGVVAFVLSYIPYIGLFTAMIPPTLLALAERGWLAAAIVVIGITAMNLTIENIVEPGYTGRRLQLSPTVVFLSFFFWAWLLGPVGALLSMPITVMLFLVCQRDESTLWLAQIIGREFDGSSLETAKPEESTAGRTP